MLASALRDGSAGRRCVFEGFARRLPDGRRSGVVAAGDRPVVEMGSRRTHEDSAVAAARAAYLAGFASTSNLAAGQRYGVPTAGTAAHAFVLLHDDEATAFAGQLATLGPSTTLL